MDPKHEASHSPSPDNAHDKPHGDKPVPPTNEHGRPHTDPAVESPKSEELVDLGQPGAATHQPDDAAGPSSGISVIEWASLVEEDPPTDTGSAPTIDAPSDADWLNQTLRANPPVVEEPVVLEEAPEEVVHAAELADDEPTVVPGSASDISFDEPDVMAEDMEVVRSAFAVDSSDSMERAQPPVMEFADEPEVIEAELAPADSDIVQAALVDDGEDAVAGGVDKDEVDLSAISSTVSGVALVDEPSEAPSSHQMAETSGVNLAEEELISDDLAAAMVAGGEGAPPDEPRSGRDLIAEEVESGVDLHKPTKDLADDMLEAEAGQAAAAESNPLLAGKVESAVIEGQLVEDVVHDDSETVGLGDSPKRHKHESSVVLSGEPPAKKGGDTADMELGSASGHLLSADLNYTNDPAIDAPESGPKSPQPLASEEVDFGSDEDIHIPDQPESEATGDDELTEVDTPPAAAEKPAKAAKKEKAGSGALGWIGGGLVGAVVATGACAGLWFSGLLGSDNKPLVNNNPIRQQQQPVDKPIPFDAKLALVRNGDFSRAADAGIEKIDENNPAELEARGEYRWLSYFQKQRQAGVPIKADDEAVKLAQADLAKVTANAAAPPAAKADALFWTGHIQEMTNGGAAALPIYDQGSKEFMADPVLKRRFDAAKTRLGLLTPTVPGGVGQLLPDERERQVLLALLLPLLQAEPPKPGPGQPGAAETPEAGYDFWDAVALARSQNFAEAIKKIDSASALHDKRRFEQLRKSQNPLSDPNEDIFLRVCAELKFHWQVQEWLLSQGTKLVADKVITDPKELGKGIDQLLAEHKTAAADKAKVAKIGEALVAAKIIAKPEELEQGVAKLLADRTAAETEIAGLKTAAKTAQTEIDGLKTAVKTAKGETEKEMKLRVAAEVKVLATDEMKKAIRKELVDGKVLDAAAGDEKLVPAVRDVVKIATTDASKQAMLKLQKELTEARDQVTALTARHKEELAERWQPSEMLTVWLPLLEDRSSKEWAAKAVQDAKRVLKDGTSAQKAHAEVVRGLALRNEEKYDEAKTALDKAKAELPKDDTVWHSAVDAALSEIKDPGAIYVARADALEKKGEYEEAVKALTHAVAALPKEKNSLVAKRSLVELEAAKAKASSKLTAQDPLVAAAEKDAKAASEAGAPLGHYALGRVLEELGDYTAAAQHYDDAIKAHPAKTGDGSLFRIARARVLLLSAPARPATPPVGFLDGKDPAKARETLAILVAFTLQPPLGQRPPNVDEAVKLAQEIIDLGPDKVPYGVRAEAFSILNDWPEALRTFAKGSKASKDLDQRHADLLLHLINDCPQLKRPGSNRIPNPLLAEAYYGAGIRQYFDKHYGDAEKEFVEAVKNDSQDARYHYFLGLSRLALNKDEAYDDFAQGALLEAKDRPSRAAVSTALERVQGPVRTIVNEAREKSR